MDGDGNLDKGNVFKVPVINCWAVARRSSRTLPNKPLKRSLTARRSADA